MSEKLEKNENAIPLTTEQAEQVTGGTGEENSRTITCYICNTTFVAHWGWNTCPGCGVEIKVHRQS